MQNTIIKRTKKLIKLLIENNIKQTEFMNIHEGQIYPTEIQDWTGRYFSISTKFKEILIDDITSLGCKVIKENENSLLIFLGVDYKAENLKLSTQELVEIFSYDEI
ncbi:hypothetical protein [Poseidonibacter ostreae]|uniref:Uncharacterized protein n=1 Tax=Poseidonibacter ostreae TaxID=2654171 RepID=A0A6L4WTI9_9BACT|nr:hypothetical protein [Poseidonibacter ostreae]KAB7889555.1 hypothetical protein GBG19_05730 [Poseidonibacter ostreae]